MSGLASTGRSSTVRAPDMWRLSVQERQLSALRRQLHQQIDAGVAGAGILEREKRVSAERRELHQLIAALAGRRREEPA